MKYQGHKNWNHWNVCLWLMNEEPLYRLLRYCLRCSSTKDLAAKRLLSQLPKATPDGAPYTLSAVRAALVGE